jgi:hypothetical protein
MVVIKCNVILNSHRVGKKCGSLWSLGSVPRIAQDIRVGGEAGAVVCDQVLKDLVPVLLHKIHHNELRKGTMTGDCDNLKW